MKIAVIGTGYVGLVSGTCFAELGHEVTCIDNDSAKVDALRARHIPIYEPSLDELVEQNTQAGRLSFTHDLEEGIADAAAVFIAVGTPTNEEDGSADLSYVFAVAEELAPLLHKNAIVITKSTVPVGTGSKIHEIIAKARPDLAFEVASNPEFLREGCAIQDFMEPDRIIVGVESDATEEVLQQLYKPLTDKGAPILFTDIKTAELTKYAANAFLASKITFINEIADICERVGADIEDVAKGMGYDKRIGATYLQPGPGFGGSCFPKDTLALKHAAEIAGVPIQIVESTINANEARKERMVEKIIAGCGGSVEGKRLAILGLAFKANTDDVRDSASLVIIPGLQQAGAQIRAFDPEAMEQAKKQLEGDIGWCEDAYDALEGADAAVIITEWDEFRTLDMERAKSLLKTPVIIDLRNLFDPADMQARGVHYVSLGRPVVVSLGASADLTQEKSGQ